METTKTLVLVFKATNNQNDIRLTISKPNEGLDGPAIKTQTDEIIASNIFGNSMSQMTVVKEAYWTTRTVNAVDLEM